jgi:hypothetical protein
VVSPKINGLGTTNPLTNDISKKEIEKQKKISKKNPKKSEKNIWDTRFYNLPFGYKNMYTKRVELRKGPL